MAAPARGQGDPVKGHDAALIADRARGLVHKERCQGQARSRHSALNYGPAGCSGQRS